MDPPTAIRLAAIRRFRPIMMTTLAALMGRCPWRSPMAPARSCAVPLGVAMVFGLLLSQALTLFTTPVVYLYLSRLATRLGEDVAGVPAANPVQGANP